MGWGGRGGGGGGGVGGEWNWKVFMVDGVSWSPVFSRFM